MRNFTRCCILLLALPVLLAAAGPDKLPLLKEVADMEHQFCAMAKDKGLLAAFQHFAAPDVAFIDTDPRKWRGPAAVLELQGFVSPQ